MVCRSLEPPFACPQTSACGKQDSRKQVSIYIANTRPKTRCWSTRWRTSRLATESASTIAIRCCFPGCCARTPVALASNRPAV